MKKLILFLFLSFSVANVYAIEKRAMNIAQGGEISFPGGKIEKEDPSCIETALRETFEEIGIKKERIMAIISAYADASIVLEPPI